MALSFSFSFFVSFLAAFSAIALITSTGTAALSCG
jgi:hypothetical protein